MQSTTDQMDYSDIPSRSIDSPDVTRVRSTRGRLHGRSVFDDRTGPYSRPSSTSTPVAPRRSVRVHAAAARRTASSSPAPTMDDDDTSSALSLPPPRASESSGQTTAPMFDLSFDDRRHPRSKSTATRSGKMKKEAIFEHFIASSDGLYRCKLCEKLYTASEGQASNLRRHLWSAHGFADAAFNSQIIQSNRVTHDNPSMPSLSKARQEQLNSALLNCIIDDGLPFTTFSKPGMINVLTTFEPNYRPPDRHTLSDRVTDIYEAYVNDLKEILPNCGPIAFTCDVWKSGARNYYISLTGHVFSDEFESVPLMLSFRQLTGRKLAVNLAAFIRFELDTRFKLIHQVRAGITTDCGTDIEAATRSGVFGTRHSCFAHLLNLVIKNRLCLWEPPDPNNYSSDVTIKSKPKEAIQVIEGDEDNLLDEEDPRPEADIHLDENDTPVQPSSAPVSTTATNRAVDIRVNTSVRNIVQNSSDDQFLSEPEEEDEENQQNGRPKPIAYKGLFDALERLNKLLKRCRSFIDSTRQIGVIQLFVRKEMGGRKRGFVLDVEVRWNSTFMMLARLLTHQTIVYEIMHHKFDGLSKTQEKRMKTCWLTPDDWELLQSLYHVLEGFYIATTIISSSHYPTLADVYWITTQLHRVLQIKPEDNNYTRLLKGAALDGLKDYSNVHVSKEQRHATLVAAFLDPETHNEMNDEAFKKASQLVKEKMLKLPAPSAASLQIATSNSSLTATDRSSKALTSKIDAKERLKQLAGNNSSDTSSKGFSIDEEFNTFCQTIKGASSFKVFWVANRRNFPRLVELARKHNIVPATSVASESAFSIAGYIARKQRTSLSSTTLRQLLVLKYRKNLDKLRPKTSTHSAPPAVSIDHATSAPVITTAVTLAQLTFDD